MKRAIALLLMAGCADLPPQGGAATPAAADPGPTALDFEKFVVTQFAFDPSFVRTGYRATYVLKVQGEGLSEHHSIAAVADAPNGVWVEIRRPAPPVGMIEKSLYERTGRLLERWVGPPGGSPAQTYPPPGQPLPPPGPRQPVPVKVQEVTDRISVGGRGYDCLRLTSPLKYPDGRMGTLVSWFSAEVPFSGTAKYGGIVKRTAGRASLELLTHAAAGAKPELDLPR
jgi:hypothetical protein